MQVYSEAIYFEDKFDSYEVGVHYLNTLKNRIVNNIPIVGNEMRIIGLHGDTYMKGMVMHTLRSVINNDKIWFEILKEFMVEMPKVLQTQEIFSIKLKKRQILIIGILLSNTFILQINLS